MAQGDLWGQLIKAICQRCGFSYPEVICRAVLLRLSVERSLPPQADALYETLRVACFSVRVRGLATALILEEEKCQCQKNQDCSRQLD
ncbi:hypothetical protein [Nostoc sp.]|uniref:hypothetical protein n=1 Tax=Nostoc sp. TaxID=1180 RepID=UPI002FF625B6